MERIDVIITWPLWEALTYYCETVPPEGSRVKVPVGKSHRIGFVLGRSVKKLDDDVGIKTVSEVIESKRVLDSDLWDMALWSGRVCMCGAGEALKLILPKRFLDGERLDAPPDDDGNSGTAFSESHCFNPFDSERVNFYLDALSRPGRVLMMLPGHERAKDFFTRLPDSLKSEALLWPSSVTNKGVKLWESWKLAHSGHVRVIISAPNGVFAPLRPNRFIIEDEANPSYVMPYALNISARSLAGHRAAFLGSEFITGGRLPSLKTFKRLKPEERPDTGPDRRNIIIADMNVSHQEKSRGIAGSIHLTKSLLKRTYRALAESHNVIWILNRLGDASEIFCENCGESLRCPRCHNLMRSENDGRLLRCRVCGKSLPMPEKCEHCGYEFLTGKRQGLEALRCIAERYFGRVLIYGDKSNFHDMKGLILSTERGLNLCCRIHPELIAWLDLDCELSWPEYSTRYRVFANLWESYWSGRENDSHRKVLIQARKSGRDFAMMLRDDHGLEKFFTDELLIRHEYTLPPSGYMLELSCRDKNSRECVIKILDSAGLFVMDSGDESGKLYVNTRSLETVRRVLEPLYSVSVKNLNRARPDILIRSE